MSIVVENLTKKYKNQIAVNHISFSLKKGEITGFLGPNGAGKSTTMKMLTGALTPSQGKIHILEKDLCTHATLIQQKIGYLPEHNPLYLDMYVREYLEFCADIHNTQYSEIQKVINLTQLNNEAHKKIEELSKGYRQRVGLASALLHNPEILILDEPTTGLDPNQIIEIRKIIKDLSKDKTILLSSHIMQEIQAMCDRVIILDKGNIVLDKYMSELQNTEQTIEVLFDYRVEEPFFKQLAHLKSVNNNYDFFYTLTFDTQKDMRPAIFDFATKNGLKLLQINHKHQGLEDIFVRLTQKN